MSFIEELKWRGMLQDITSGLEKQLEKEITTGYVGFDPTADSLHIGNLVPVMLLVHLQRNGHKPIALVGGATGMVGDPSGKTAERQLLDLEKLNHNLACQKSQLERFLDFTPGPKSAELVNNYDWFREFGFLDFIREVGKHITINYMMAKDSVQNRLESGMSFTEFSYQLIQGYDFVHLFKEKNCLLQMGGSDQWGNITTGTELIRRMTGGEAYALTAPLLKKADGSKFGKSEGGNVWLDKTKTSPYKFYQYWLNVSDEDAPRLIRTFTLLDKPDIENIEKQHNEAPHLRLMQKKLAEEVTRWVHGRSDLDGAIRASGVLFGQSTEEDLRSLSENDFLSVFDGVPQASLPKSDFETGITCIDALVIKSGFLKSNGEAKRALAESSISLNKTRIDEGRVITSNDLISGKYCLLQRGKKNYFLLIAQ